MEELKELKYITQSNKDTDEKKKAYFWGVPSEYGPEELERGLKALGYNSIIDVLNSQDKTDFFISRAECDSLTRVTANADYIIEDGELYRFWQSTICHHKVDFLLREAACTAFEERKKNAATKNISGELHLALNKNSEIPQAIDGSIFGNDNSEETAETLETLAFKGIWNAAYTKGLLAVDENKNYRVDEYGGYTSSVSTIIDPNVRINVYATDFTAGLVAVLNVCRQEGLSVTLWHYDEGTKHCSPSAELS